MKNNYLSEEHALFRITLKDFLQREVVPHLDEWEKRERVPKDIWLKFGEMGFLGLNIPTQYGGSGLDFWYLAILTEELSKINSGGFAAAILAHVSLAMVYLERFASDELKQKYLPKCCTGEWVGALAVTEPHAGSDVQGIQTKATKEGEDYILNGSKTFITNGVYSDFLIVAAKTDKEGTGTGLFVVDRNTRGLSATPLKKLGWQASDTGEIAIQEVRVAASQVIGEPIAGFYYIMQNFALERLVLALGAVAACEVALEYTLKYMTERKAFGRPIAKFQVLRHRVAQLAAEIACNKQFNYNIVAALIKDENVIKECAMAKLLSTELSDKVMTECLQCLGGYGFMEDYPLARMFRDSRLGTIGGGTSEIMRDLIAKMLVDEIQY